MQRPLRHHALDAVLDGFAEARVRDVLGAARGLVETAQIEDAPFDVEVDVELFLFTGEESFRRVELRDDALVEAAHILDQGDPEMQARLEIRLDDLAADRLDRELALAHREDAGAHDQNHGDQGQQHV